MAQMAHRSGGRAGGMAMALGLMVLVLAACSSSKDENPTVSGATATTAAPTTVAATTTTAPPVVKTATNAQFGTILVDASSGKTLYMFDRDTSSTSSCTGGCATTWPALLLAGGVSTATGAGVTGSLASAARPDG